jgi:hypothetical protein
MRCLHTRDQISAVRSRVVSLLPVLLQPWEYNLSRAPPDRELGVGCGSMNDQ